MDHKKQFLENKFIYCISLFILFASTKCTGQKNQQSELINNISGQVWIHSFEDDEMGIEAYRPKEYNFPPARGREGFEIKEDGTFILYSIAPTDGTLPEKGSWTMSDKGIEVVVSKGNSKQDKFIFEVISLEEGLLKIKRKGNL